MDPLMIGGIVAVALIAVTFIPGVRDFFKSKGDAAKSDVDGAVNKATAQIKGVLDGLDIPQPLQNIKRFVEVGLALAAIDGTRTLAARVVPTDRLSTVEAALATARTEVASVLLTEVKTV